MIELRGQRVVLRALERDDCRQLWEAYEPAAPQPTEPLHLGLTVEGAEAWFAEIQAGQEKDRLHLGIFTLDGRLLGDIQLSAIDWRNRTAELGLGIARAADRGQGYGRAAARLLLDYAFNQFDLARISASTLAYNTAAARGLEQGGFVPEGRDRAAVFLNGRRHDRLRFGLLRAEYLAADEEA
ncbi:conserved protein of unknown function [Candidatus Promineifilum breve]|uniref:N-acetyltransferase domain-containing protein n=1 Tax=Candidatus Promineifilum breve TaxID=1806508 RepID=A0A160T422_9CHLR|nr:GNAT family protein [Candidatus Promineifilum breve]CUS03798.2 conserved protein of unknown function [Candidatus Promineifilum breve]